MPRKNQKKKSLVTKQVPSSKNSGCNEFDQTLAPVAVEPEKATASVNEHNEEEKGINISQGQEEYDLSSSIDAYASQEIFGAGGRIITYARTLNDVGNLSSNQVSTNHKASGFNLSQIAAGCQIVGRELSSKKRIFSYTEQEHPVTHVCRMSKSELSGEIFGTSFSAVPYGTSDSFPSHPDVCEQLSTLKISQECSGLENEHFSMTQIARNNPLPLEEGAENYEEMISNVNILQTSSLLSPINSSASLPFSPSDFTKITAWHLPKPIVDAYRTRGISQLFLWQVNCMLQTDILNGKNCVYSAPTSGGKTLVAEFVLFKTVFEKKKKGLLIQPYVSLVQEKVKYLQNIASHTSIKVDGLMGQYYPPGGFQALDIAVCTFEKADRLINKIVEKDAIHELGVVVIDEIHMLGERKRGYILELLLMKLVYISKIKNVDVQIIGMSATLPNIEPLSNWLKGTSFTSLYRPVPLKETIKIGHVISLVDGSPYRNLATVKNPIERDSDYSIYLSIETVLHGHSVLMFCSSKAGCEEMAQRIANEIFCIGTGITKIQDSDKSHMCQEQWQNAMPLLRNYLRGDLLKEVLSELEDSPAGLDASLSQTVGFGVAFHHAGLTFYERNIIEKAFRQGVIKILIATTTLASGVNLPARRVIIRSPTHMGEVMDIRTYKQMIGRAGRTGIDSEGESILICKENEKPHADVLRSSQMPPVKSSLKKSNVMQQAILGIIAIGAASTLDDLISYISSSFEFHQSECSGRLNNDTQPCTQSIKSQITKHINELINMQFIFMEKGDKGVMYFPTRLGKAAISASMSVELALRIVHELELANRNFILQSDLHILYHVTPTFVSDQLGTVDWNVYSSIFDQLSEDEKLVADAVGVKQSFIDRSRAGHHFSKNTRSSSIAEIHRRFYVALALQDLIKEVPLTQVATKFSCSKGVVQSLQQNAAVFAGMVVEFCRALSWRNLGLLFESFQKRLHFGVLDELCDLLQLSSLDGCKARVLYDGHFTTVAEVAKAKPEQLTLLFHNSEAFQRTSPDSKLHIQKLCCRDEVIAIIKEAQVFVERSLGVACIPWTSEPNSNTESILKPQSSSIKSEVETSLSTSEVFGNTFLTHQAPGSVMPVSTSTPTSEAAGHSTSLNTYLKAVCEKLSQSEVASTHVSRKNASNLDFCHPAQVTSSELTVSQRIPHGSPVRSLEINVIDVMDINKFSETLKYTGTVAMALACERNESSHGIGLYACSAEDNRTSCVAVGISLYFGTNVYYINLSESRSQSNGNIANEEMMKKAKQLVEDDLKGHDVVISDISSHYSAFSQYCQIFLPNDVTTSYQDPIVAGWLLNNCFEKQDLLALVYGYLHAEEIKSYARECKQCSGSFALNYMDSLPAKRRSAIEVFVVYNLMEVMKVKLCRATLWEHFTCTEMPCSLFLAMRDDTGIACSPGILSSCSEKINNHLVDLQSKIEQIARCRINLNSDAAIHYLLFLVLQLHKRVSEEQRSSLMKVSKTSQYRTNKHNLRLLSGVHPLPGLLMSYRSSYYVLHNIIKALMEELKFSKRNNTWRSHGTSNIFSSSGRIYIHGSPLQCMPKDLLEETSIGGHLNLRCGLIPSTGCLFIAFDYSLMEMRIMAHLSGDEALCRDFNMGVDIFRKMSALVWETPENLVTEEMRSNAKRQIYAFMYGGVVSSIAREIGMPVELATSLCNVFVEAYPQLIEFRRLAVAEAVRRGSFNSVAARRVVVRNNPTEEWNMDGKIFNKIVQSSASDIFKLALVKVNKEIIQTSSSDICQMVLHVHDELLFDVECLHIREFAPRIKYIMENCKKLLVPLSVKVHYGHSFGHMIPYI